MTETSDAVPTTAGGADDPGILGPGHHLLDGVTGFPDDVARRYVERGWWTDEVLGDLVHRIADRAPDAIALVGPSVRMTYREAAAAIDGLTADLAALGVGVDDRVVVHMPSAPSFVLALMALWRRGALPVFSLPGHGSREVAGFVSGSGARLVLSGRSATPGADHVGVARAAIDEARRVHGVDGELRVAVVDPGGRLEEAPDRTGAVEPYRPHPRDIAFLQLSGGTTGTSKLIPRSHADYLYSVRGSNEICAVDAGTVMLVALPAAHNFPMSSTGILGVLLAGGTCVFPGDPSPANAFALVEAEGVTTTGLVPSMLLSWLGSTALDPERLGSLRTVLVGGAPLDAGTAARVRTELGCRLQQVFGMAEGLVCYTRLDDPDDVNERTQGLPISADDEVRIVDDAGRPVPPGETGHLLTRGPYTIRGYYRPDARARSSFDDDGFYRSGDLVSWDPSGNIRVRGRATETVNRAGEKILPAEVEGQLREHPAVADAAVFGVPDEVLGERLEARVVAVDPAAPPRAVELRRHLKERGLARFKVPDRIEVVAELPRTAVGKTAGRRLREPGDDRR